VIEEENIEIFVARSSFEGENDRVSVILIVGHFHYCSVFPSSNYINK
jgi:hypothetical protein